MNMFKRVLTLFLGLSILLLGVSTAAFADSWKNHGKDNSNKEVKYQLKGIEVKSEFKITTHSKKNTFKFKDATNHWAVSQISAMHLQGVISGYPDLNFQPEKAVTRNEALLMICRTVGFNKDQYTAQKERDNVPDWVRECIDFAVEKGIISESEAENFHGNSPAKRFEVAIWAAKAANLDASTGVDFVDSQDIPYFAKPYIGSMYHLGYMVGYPGNLFQPNKPIKRAEIAVLLFNMLPDFDQVLNSKVVRGTISEVDGDTITINDKTYEISDETEIYVNGKSADLDDVTEEAKAVLYLNSKDEVIYLYAKEVDEDEDNEALKIQSYDPGENEKNVDRDIDELVVEFNQDITAKQDLDDVLDGIVIKAYDDNENIDITRNIDVDSIEIKNDTLTISLKNKLEYDENCTVTIAEDIIKAEDSDETNDKIEWKFTVESEEELEVKTLNPSDDATEVDRDIDELVVKFNQDIEAEDSLSGVLDAISINHNIDVESVKIDDNTLTIELADELDYDENYTVAIEKGVIQAEDSNETNDQIEWQFTTEEEDE